MNLGLYYHKPCPALQHFIRRITLVQFQVEPNEQCQANPFPPQHEHCLYFYPHDKVTCYKYADQSFIKLPACTLIGPHLSRVDLSMGPKMLVIVVGFLPGGMHRLLGVPMQEMIDTPLDATLFLGKEIEDVNEQLFYAKDFKKMVEIIQSYLLQKVNNLKRILPVDQVIAQLIQKRKLVSVDQLAQEACVSIRQLERQFKERIGLSPKLYIRLIRFSRAWYMREKNLEISWLEIAYSCGYADQMHMIRDFRDFVGVAPTILQADLEKSLLRMHGTTFES